MRVSGEPCARQQQLARSMHGRAAITHEDEVVDADDRCGHAESEEAVVGACVRAMSKTRGL